MIIVESLTRRYAGFTAVDDVSFTALPGRVTGFLGPKGAGKTTTMRVMVGPAPPDVRHGRHQRSAFRRPPQPWPRRGRPPGRLRPARRSHRTRGPDDRR